MRAVAVSGVDTSLAAVAFEREDAAAYRQWSRLDRPARRAAMADPNVLLCVVTRASRLLGAHVAGARRALAGPLADIPMLLGEIASDLRATRREFPREWFEALERWTEAALDHLHLDWAAQALQLAVDTGVASHPSLHQALRASEAELCARSGRLDEAAEIALWYVRRPYLLLEGRHLPAVLRRLAGVLLLTGHIAEHRLLLWRGLRETYARAELREGFAACIRQTYRGYMNALFRSGARVDDRAQLVSQLLFDSVRRMPACRSLRLDRVLYWTSAALGYAIARRKPASSVGQNAAVPLNAILVTRAIGGIGDLLMMTPGLRALARAHPQTEVHFAVPRSLLPLLSGNGEFAAIDIESPTLDPARYRAWFDLTSCPAARVESRQAPNVRIGRIALFASALGVPARKLRGAAGRPRYAVAHAEREAAERETDRLRRSGRPLVGLQWHAADSYRDYPHNGELLRLLAAHCNVLVFGTRGLPAAAGGGVHLVSRPLREAFALAAQCDVLVGPDSSFLHLAGALEKPMVLVAGPVDGALRAEPYPSVVPIVPSRRDFPCAPCWRNESIDCSLSGRRESVCLRSIAPETVAARVFALLSQRPELAPRPQSPAPALRASRGPAEGRAC